jgi:hypothetical protein
MTPYDRKNELDGLIADAQHLADALSALAANLIPEENDEIRQPLFAVLDALREKLVAVEKSVDDAKAPEKGYGSPSD